MSDAQERAIAVVESVRSGAHGLTVLSAWVADDGKGEALVSVTAALDKAAAPCERCGGTGRDTYSPERDCWHCGGRKFGEGWGKGATIHRVPFEGASPDTRKLGKHVAQLVRGAWARAAGL